MITKTKLIETIKQFPEQFSIDDLLKKLILIEKIEKADLQSINGETVSEKELEQEIKRWFN